VGSVYFLVALIAGVAACVFLVLLIAGTEYMGRGAAAIGVAACLLLIAVAIFFSPDFVRYRKISNM
jgi:hypothetical protein